MNRVAVSNLATLSFFKPPENNMSEELNQDAAAEAAAPAPAPEVVKQSKRKLGAVTPTSGFKAYQSTGTHTYPFDIMVKGEMVNGQWMKADGFVEFLVPDHLVEGFEKHHHFISGNVVAE
jgi:hypothetical protein